MASDDGSRVLGVLLCDGRPALHAIDGPGLVYRQDLGLDVEIPDRVKRDFLRAMSSVGPTEGDMRHEDRLWEWRIAAIPSELRPLVEFEYGDASGFWRDEPAN